MKPLLSALVIPETKPAVHVMGSLLMFFESLSFYLPAESDSADPGELSPLKESCTGYAPAPLGEDLKRFNRLLQEMANSRSDDLARLFSSAKSPIAAGEVRDRTETSTGSVFAALHMDNSKIAHIQQKERLWQARLVLKLAELLDRREREVREGLAHITRAEQKILSLLEGDNATGQAVPEEISELEQGAQLIAGPEYAEVHAGGSSAMLANLRLKAWAELFLADNSPDRPAVLVAPLLHYGNSILDGYESIWKKEPEKLFTVTLPGIPGPESPVFPEEQYFSERTKLRQAVHNHLASLGNYLRETACSDSRHATVPENVAAWEEAVKTCFPALKAQRKLDFYCFPGTSPENLLAKLFHLTPFSFDAQSPKKTILAVLHAWS